MNECTYFDIPIHVQNDIKYICFDDIPEEHKEAFGVWMFGQTVIEGPACGEKMAGIFLWDFERWYKMKFHDKPTYFD